MSKTIQNKTIQRNKRISRNYGSIYNRGSLEKSEMYSTMENKKRYQSSDPVERAKKGKNLIFKKIKLTKLSKIPKLKKSFTYKNKINKLNKKNKFRTLKTDESNFQESLLLERAVSSHSKMSQKLIWKLESENGKLRNVNKQMELDNNKLKRTNDDLRRRIRDLKGNNAEMLRKFSKLQERYFKINNDLNIIYQSQKSIRENSKRSSSRPIYKRKYNEDLEYTKVKVKKGRTRPKKSKKSFLYGLKKKLTYIPKGHKRSITDDPVAKVPKYYQPSGNYKTPEIKINRVSSESSSEVDKRHILSMEKDISESDSNSVVVQRRIYETNKTKEHLLNKNIKIPEYKKKVGRKKEGVFLGNEQRRSNWGFSRGVGNYFKRVEEGVSSDSGSSEIDNKRNRLKLYYTGK
jgi:hypothetical protein